MIVDYTTLDAPVVRLTLEQTDDDRYTTVDQTSRVYYPPTENMDTVIRFMRAMAIKGHAELDEGSITWFRALRVFGPPAFSGEGPQARTPVVSPAVAAHEPASSPGLDLAPVIPIRRHTA